MAKADAPKMVAVAAIYENPWNPNEVPAEIMAALKRNIERFGFNQPILVRPIGGETLDGPVAYEVVDGAHRFRAAVELGIDKVPVVVREFTDAEAKAQTIAMNRLRGEMDPVQMATLVREINEEGIDGIETLSEFIGYNDAELAELDKQLAPEIPPTPKPANDQSGEVGDGYFIVVTCTSEQDQLALLERLEGEGYEARLVVS